MHYLIKNIETPVIKSFVDYWDIEKDNFNKNAKDNGMMHLINYEREFFDMMLGEYYNSERFNSGNIFWHEHPYFPHVDLWDSNNKWNVVVPLVCQDDNQKLIIFDQTYHEAATWVGDITKRSFHGNPAIYKRICDTPGVEGLTGKPCPDHLLEHLPYSPDFYHGLSGTAIDWEVGISIEFKAEYIHCSGKMNTPKIGSANFLND